MILVALLGCPDDPATTLLPLEDAEPAPAPIGPDTVLYVVRHAEKETASADPGITPDGQLRAEALAHLLRDVPLDGVHSTDTARTLATAGPTAVDQGLDIAVYSFGDLTRFVEDVLAVGGSHLVVGHSYSMGDTVAAAGGDPDPEIDDGQYDRMYVVVVSGEGPVATLLLTYGAPSP